MNDYNDDLPSLPRAGGPVSGRKPLGKLTQSARGAELGKARRILLVVGVLTLLANVGTFFFAENLADNLIKAEQMKQPGLMVSPAERDTFINATKVASGLVALLGGLFVVFGLIVQKFPVPITVASLVLYIGQVAIFAVIIPGSLVSGIIFKLIIVVALVKAVQAAIAMQREDREAGGAYA